MFDLIVTEHHTDRDILLHIMKELKAMSLNMSAANDALAKLSADIDALIASDTAVLKAVADVTATHQSQVDGLVPSIVSLSVKADAVLHPPAPPEGAAS